MPAGSKLVVYLCRDGVDVMVHAILVSWLISYVDYCVDYTWSRAVLLYCVACSSLNGGRVLAESLREPDPSHQENWPLVLLAISFMGLMITSRISHIIMLVFLIGYSAGMMKEREVRSQTRSNRLNNVDLASRLLSSSNDVGSEITSQRRIATFAFAVLLGGVLYRDGKYADKWPVARLCVVVSSTSIVIFFLNLWIARVRFRSFEKEKSLKKSATKALRQTARLRASNEVHKTQCVDVAEGEKYEGDVPITFIKWYGGNLARARKAYGRTLQWRKENDLDTILTIPQNHFHEIIEYYPHAIHGRSRDGCVVLYEILGRAQPKELEKVDGLTFEGLVWHFVLRNEYVFQIMCTRDECLRWEVCRNDEERESIENIPPEMEGKGKLMTVLDVKGIRVADITADVISFIRKSSEIIDSHFPFRVQRLVICNAPSWFSSVWTMVARVLPDNVRKKISIIHGVDGLNAVIDPSQRPEEYGGTDVPLGQSPEMLEFVALEKNWKYKDEEPEMNEKGSSGKNNSDGYHPVDISKASMVRIGSSSSMNSDRDRDARELKDMRRFSVDSMDSAESAESESSSGVLSWMRSKMLGSNVKEAHLGAKNAYRYDEERGSWTIDVDEDSVSSTPRRSVLSPAQLEEHGLVLAIQAAHMASRSQKSETGEPDSYDVGRQPYSPGSSSKFGGLEMPAVPIEENIERQHKISAQVFLLVTTMYSVACLAQTMLITLIPAWLATNRMRGGLGFTVLDRAYAMSAAGILVYLLHVLCIQRFTYVLRASPIRALRIGSGFLVVMCFLTPIVLYSFCSEISTITQISQQQEKSHHQVIHELYFDMNLADHDTVPEKNYMIGTDVSVADIYSPGSYILAVPVVAIFLAASVVAAFVCRKAAGLLLYIALAPTFSSPYSVISLVGNCIEIGAPMIGALIYMSTYHSHLQFPMNASFHMAICACMTGLIYLGSLLLSVQFRGDFGVMPDEAVKKPSPAQSHTGTHTLRSLGRNHVPADDGGSGLTEMLDIPLSDLTLLLAPPSGGYGTRMHNMKIDLKEV
jgi:hypothetical protein